jgi:hypothetical protein
MNKLKPKRKRLKPLKSVLDARMGPDKPEPKDPLAGLKRKHRGPYTVLPIYNGEPEVQYYAINDSSGKRVAETDTLLVARAIARMGAK